MLSFLCFCIGLYNIMENRFLTGFALILAAWEIPK